MIIKYKRFGIEERFGMEQRRFGIEQPVWNT